MVDIVRIELKDGRPDIIMIGADYAVAGKLTALCKTHKLLKKQVCGISHERITEDAAKELNLII